MRFQFVPVWLGDLGAPRLNRRPDRRARRPAVESVESRALLSTMLPDVVMDSATTADSRSVTITYDINNTSLSQPLTFGVYRSAEDHVDSGSVSVATATVSPSTAAAPTRDTAGQPATGQGHHELNIYLPDGLPPDPSHPYVVVAADPSHTIAQSSNANDSAAFRKHIIAVITHGGLQNRSWKNTGAPWARTIATSLLAEGYDAAIPYNWVAASIHPGEAAKQGPFLARRILQVASQFPPSDPVDLHFIGHSEGTVVNTIAIEIMKTKGTPQIHSGFIVDTMLDPHAANNSATGGQLSSKHGVTGWLAKTLVGAFQWEAKDPLVSVPSNVGLAQVYFQHTPIKMAGGGSNHGIYNLWGQRVRGVAEYANLSGPGISHAGNFRVQDWYQQNVVPLLAHGPVFVNPGVLSGGIPQSIPVGPKQRTHVVTSSQPTITGTAFPGATVRLYAASPASGSAGFVGQAIAAADGSWSVVSRPLRDGHYRLLLRGRVSATPKNPTIEITPRANLGTLVVDTQGRLRRIEAAAARGTVSIL
jgi:hypothetical protein